MEMTCTFPRRNVDKIFDKLFSLSNNFKFLRNRKDLFESFSYIAENEKIESPKYDYEFISFVEDFQSLDKINKTQLISVALGIESYDRLVNGNAISCGLREYIYSLEEEQIKSLINGYLDKLDIKLKSIWDHFLIPGHIEFDIDKYLEIASRSYLDSLAQTAEKIDRDRNDIKVTIGGINNLLNNMTHYDVRKYIKSVLVRYPDVDSQYLKQYGINNGLIRDNKTDEIIDKLDKEVLISYVQAAEAYDARKLQKYDLGLLHDYLNNLSRNELLKILSRYIEIYPNLNKEKLNYLVIFGNYNHENDPLSFLTNEFRSSLIIYAIAYEKYDREVQNISYTSGSIIDLVNDMQTSTIIEYIKSIAIKYPEHDKSKLDELVKKYCVNNCDVNPYMNYFNFPEILSLVYDDMYVLKAYAIGLAEYDYKITKDPLKLESLINDIDIISATNLRTLIQKMADNYNFNFDKVVGIAVEYGYFNR
jgi:hypothetical protein